MRPSNPCSSSVAVKRPLSRAMPPRKGISRLFPVVFVCLFVVLAARAQAAQIADYRVISQPVRDRAGRLRLAVRSFTADGVPHLLLVDPVALVNYDLPASQLAPSNDAVPGSTPFLKALERYSAAPDRLQNAGAARSDLATDGVFLTVDLCPSRRRFERELFESAATLGKGAPVPVAVAVSGVWLVNHPDETAYLQSEVAAGRLSITWVNHSYHHTYDPKIPLAKNFLLTPGTDLTREVLDLEEQLLSRGLVPSPFFRFPGLVSDGAAVRRLKELSLIPIGSDAWLAKGESPRGGSFILVHGNGNEPKGVKLLLPMLRNRELRLLPLPAAFGP